MNHNEDKEEVNRSCPLDDRYIVISRWVHEAAIKNVFKSLAWHGGEHFYM